ncbi:hypothetical protein [Planctomycetes bacterium CA13]
MTHRKNLLAATIASAIGLAVFTPMLVHYFGVGHAPQHPVACVAWWKAPNRIGGTIDLATPHSPLSGLSIERESCTFENDQDIAVLSWRFLRNSGSDDVYQFNVRVNQEREIARTVYFDGLVATVLVDDASGTSITIESQDPFESS